MRILLQAAISRSQDFGRYLARGRDDWRRYPGGGHRRDAWGYPWRRYWWNHRSQCEGSRLVDVDIIGLGIAFCLLASAIFGALEIYHHRKIEIGNIILICFATFSIIGGVDLIMAAWHGNAEDLPPRWREYLTVSGIAGIGVALNLIWEKVAPLLSKRGRIR
uniref:Uncharacterized protein n=1 Tax=Candidatus Kentrum sp. TC TaxID=2126339 RepID=A0A450YE70_9GAMM|nr:MAG: hypothetical protein BECKTC1821E_GA0114239_100542 [Candidatus Kentron sp. TC]VFK54244.1 MAG: hypothetical protein BECKTC1821F_GA0114240_100483 [Candidatus Kentron sp. TC]